MAKLTKADIDHMAALADASALDPYDGRDVVRVDLKVTNTGDGLSAAMAVAPRQFHIGEKVRIVIDGEVASMAYKPVDPDDPDSALALVPSVKAATSLILEEATARKLDKDVKRQNETIARAHDAAKGIQRLRNGSVSVDDEAEDADDDADGLDEPAPI